MNLVIHPLVCSLCIILIHVSTWKGMVNYPAAEWLTFSKVPVFIKKPLYMCMVCMCSIWGLLYQFTFLDLTTPEIIRFVLTVGGLNVIASFTITNPADEL